jgi:prolyl 4-hydroxylase
MQKRQFKFPTEEDLNGAAIAMVRLQDVYHLNTTEVAQGLLNGVQYPSNMTISDCFEIGKQMFKSGDYVYSIDWLREALRKFVAEKSNATQLKANILEFLVMSLQREGHIQIALSLTKDIVKADPKDYKAKHNKDMLEEELRQLKRKGVVDNEDIELKDLKVCIVVHIL